MPRPRTGHAPSATVKPGDMRPPSAGDRASNLGWTSWAVTSAMPALRRRSGPAGGMKFPTAWAGPPLLNAPSPRREDSFFAPSGRGPPLYRYGSLTKSRKPESPESEMEPHPALSGVETPAGRSCSPCRQLYQAEPPVGHTADRNTVGRNKGKGKSRPFLLLHLQPLVM